MTDIADKFWERTERRGRFDCWPWLGIQRGSGRGRMVIKRKFLGAPAVSWYVHNGEWPQDRHVLHTCANPNCVNPAHLYLGDNAENMREAAYRGAHSGERHHMARLNNQIVREARKRYGEGERIADLARSYGVNFNTIKQAVNGTTWGHIR